MRKKRIGKSEPGRTNAYNLKTPNVDKYARYLATPTELLDEIDTDEKFCVSIGLSAKSRTTLARYTAIPGFWDAVNSYAKKYHSYYNTIADKGLLKRAAGCDVRKQRVTKDGDVIDVREELAPDVTACVEIKKIFGNYIPKNEITGEAIAAEMAAAYMQIRQQREREAQATADKDKGANG